MLRWLRFCPGPKGRREKHEGTHAIAVQEVEPKANTDWRQRTAENSCLLERVSNRRADSYVNFNIKMADSKGYAEEEKSEKDP